MRAKACLRKASPDPVVVDASSFVGEVGFKLCSSLAGLRCKGDWRISSTRRAYARRCERAALHASSTDNPAIAGSFFVARAQLRDDHDTAAKVRFESARATTRRRSR